MRDKFLKYLNDRIKRVKGLIKESTLLSEKKDYNFHFNILKQIKSDYVNLKPKG